MSENSFSGESGLPATVGNLVECKRLIFHKSGIGGNIPVEIGQMTSLETLDLSSNQKEDGSSDGITGGIPAEIGSLGSLEQLVLFENDMSGEFTAGMLHGYVQS